jgi:tetratricopeptide (TPR) repeat protein
VLDARQNLDGILSANLEKFKRTCESWQSSPTPMPDEAKHHKDLAEAALRENNLDKAGDEYFEALKIYPCWPEGQYGLANILGDTGWYSGAIAHMRYYLVLVPNAPDAQAANNKMSDWRGRMGR